MGAGLLIDLNDGGPRMEITAGLRCPSFSHFVAEGWGTTKTTVQNYVPGSQVIVVPHRAVHSAKVNTNDLSPALAVLSSVSVSGSTIEFNVTWSRKWPRDQYTFPCSIFQILPSSTGQGLLIRDSTDFMSIQNTATIGSCIWRGKVTVDGSWTPPAIEGIDRNRYMIFAKWSDADATIEFDGNTVRALKNWSGTNENRTVTLDVAIFASGVKPQPGTGLNFFNRNGECVFSTTKRPFVYTGRTWVPSFEAKDIGNSMVQLGTWGYRSRNYNGWCRVKFLGIVRDGNRIWCGTGRTYNEWTANYGVESDGVSGLDVLLIDAMY